MCDFIQMAVADACIALVPAQTQLRVVCCSLVPFCNTRCAATLVMGTQQESADPGTALWYCCRSPRGWRMQHEESKHIGFDFHVFSSHVGIYALAGMRT